MNRIEWFPLLIDVAIPVAIFLVIFFSIRQRWPERFVRWVRRPNP
jgi:hypothetical protein